MVNLVKYSLSNSTKQEHQSCRTEKNATIVTQPTDLCKVNGEIGIGEKVAGEGDSGIASSSSSDIACLSHADGFEEYGKSKSVDESNHLFSGVANKQATDYACADCSCCATANETNIMELCAHLCFCIACVEACNCADCSGCADCDCSGCDCT